MVNLTNFQDSVRGEWHLASLLSSFGKLLGHFSKDSDIGTLQAAALASSELLKPCQEKIFSTITVINLYKGESNDTHHRARLEVFRRNNDLLTFVKEVSVQQSEAWGEWSIAPFDSPILTSMVDLVYLLATPFIEKFSFAGWPQRPAPGPKFQEGIVALLRSPRLTSLELLRVPKEFIGLVESPFLVHLSLQRVEDYYTWPTLMRLFSEPLPPTGTTQQKHPTSLCITPDKMSIACLVDTSAIDTGAVEDLRLTSATCSTSWLSLMAHLPSLRRLCIHVDAIDPATPEITFATALLPLSKLEELETRRHHGRWTILA
ncbi:hypothetical protein BKA70DRAFT_1434908 [Coprinopsis sp. MPI-PUGE-AT-0042]|nr:hypothetical protein BKA70DRAFT_1434908 [Coprinopsis sp. MPI-PUGE-AT-0042]